MTIFEKIRKIEKTSKKIFFSLFPISIIFMISGYILLYNYKNFSQMFLSRQIIETAFNLLWISIGFTLFSDIYIKKWKN